MKKIIPLIIFITAGVLFGQIDQSYCFLGTFTIPLDEFSMSNDFDTEGFSRVGGGGGIEHNLTLGHPSFVLATDACFLVNFFNKDAYEDAIPLTVEDIKGGHYFNIPILSGLKLTVPLFSPLALYGTGQVGCTILKETNLEYTVLNQSIAIEFEPAVVFAFAFGGGIIINEVASIGVRYLNCGDPEVNYEVRIGQENPISRERQFSLSIFQLVVGLFF